MEILTFMEVQTAHTQRVILFVGAGYKTVPVEAVSMVEQ